MATVKAVDRSTKLTELERIAGVLYPELLFSCWVVSDSLWSHGLQLTQALLSSTLAWSFLRFIAIESVMLSNHHLILCCPLLLLPSVFSSIRVFSNELALCITWPNYWRVSFSFSISPSNEYSELISFRIDWFDLAVQGTLMSILNMKQQYWF